MRTFESFWTDLLQALDQKREIRNWTAANGYAIGGTFVAVTWRALTEKDQRTAVRDFQPLDPADWIVCTQVRGEGITMVGRKSFADCYFRWPTYRDNRMTRKAFGGEAQATPYLISIFKEFDSLTR